MFAGGHSNTPPPLIPYLEAIRRRTRSVQRLNEEIQRTRNRVFALETERSLAQQEVLEAQRDYREVQRKWLGALNLARRIRAIGQPTPQNRAEYAMLYRALVDLAREIRVSPAEVMRRA